MNLYTHAEITLNEVFIIIKLQIHNYISTPIRCLKYKHLNGGCHKNLTDLFKQIKYWRTVKIIMNMLYGAYI